MNDGALALALGAGVVAAVNPCGFALLPAYLSLFVLDDRPSRMVTVGRAVKANAAMTAGFAAMFGVFGLAIAPVAAAVQQYLPALTVVLGLLLVGVGVWVAAGRSLWTPSLSRRAGSGSLTVSTWSMAGFGASYAVASTGCTIAPFLAVVVTAFRSGTQLEGVVLFLVYAGGMGLVVATAAVAVVLARDGLVRQIRRAGPVLPRLGGVLLAVAGGYVAWYGAWELRVLHGGAGTDPVVEVATEMQEWLASNVAALGAGGFLIVLGALVALAWVTRHRSGPSRAGDPTDTGDGGAHSVEPLTTPDDEEQT